jgi:hypothetical protein
MTMTLINKTYFRLKINNNLSKKISKQILADNNLKISVIEFNFFSKFIKFYLTLF